jgi:hypothetical protein
MNRFLILLFLMSSKLLLAQADREISYGFFAGANYSKMSNLADVIVPNGIYEGYNLNEEAKFGPSGGLLINWKYPYAKISLQTEVSYSNQGTDLNYDDINGLEYKIHFGYSYLNIGAQFKYYPIEGLYIGAGPYVGFNLTGDNITYTSNSQEIFGDSGVYFEPDATVEKVLKESLTGKNHFYLLFSTGYEFESNLSIGVRYSLGLTDSLATEENGHRFSENKNITNSFSLIIGYSFDFDDLTNF